MLPQVSPSQAFTAPICCEVADVLKPRWQYKSPLACGGFRTYVDARVVSAQQVLDEGGFASTVLPQQQH